MRNLFLLHFSAVNFSCLILSFISIILKPFYFLIAEDQSLSVLSKTLFLVVKAHSVQSDWLALFPALDMFFFFSEIGSLNPWKTKILTSWWRSLWFFPCDYNISQNRVEKKFLELNWENWQICPEMQNTLDFFPGS